jgi:hypothetical protein
MVEVVVMCLLYIYIFLNVNEENIEGMYLDGMGN